MTKPLPERATEALEKIEGIEADMREFDGDKRGMAHNLGDAEEELAELSRPMARALLAADQLANCVRAWDDAVDEGDYGTEEADKMLAALTNFDKAIEVKP